MFSLFNFSSIFQGGQLTPFAPADAHAQIPRQNHNKIADGVCIWQESYVWGMYQQRIWDFFPVGECFRKQYEEELTMK